MANAPKKVTAKAKAEATPKTVVSKEAPVNMEANASATNLNKRSVEFGKTAKEFNEMLHAHNMNIARHIAKYGDRRPASFLVQQIRGGAKRSNGAQSVNALIQWFITFAGCTWNAQGDKFGTKKGDFKFNEVAADENPFYEFMPEPEFQPIDSVKLLQALVGRLHKAMNDDKRKNRATKDGTKDNINPDLVASLDILLAKTSPKGVSVDDHKKMNANPIPVLKTDDIGKIVARPAIVH